MKLIPDTLAGRTVAILLLGLGVFHLVSLWLYNTGLQAEIGQINERQLTERLVGIKRAVVDLPPQDRDRTAHSLSGGALKAHWSRVSLATHGATQDAPELRALEARLRELLPELAADGLRVAYGDEGGKESSRHLIVVSVRFPDDSWLNFAIGNFGVATAFWYGVFMSTTAMALGVLAISIVLVRGATSPLRAVTEAARRLGRGGPGTPIDEHGPREAREAAAAFNDMQRRITQLMEERARTMAAVSHDLKTPLTRLRFRTEFIADQETRDNIVADLSEMESMIDSALAFLRSEAESEELRQSDIASICTTICDELSDQGHDVKVTRSDSAVLPVRRLMLKRAVNNLVTNGLKYGKRVRLRVEDSASHAAVVVDDDGPGIPPDRMEQVFEPFRRLEDSRSRETGGVGLGLTVALMVARAHGGTIRLQNRPEGGLRAQMTLPKSPIR